MTLVINLFAAPGVGKSTTAAGLFYNLKSRGINAELTSEFAKQLTWDSRQHTLEDQIYVFGKQHNKLRMLLKDVDVVITDSPLLLGVVYSDAYPQFFKDTIWWAFEQFNNYNILLERTKAYNPKGRNQTLEESDAIQEKIVALTENILYLKTTGDPEGLDEILEIIVPQILWEKDYG